MKRYRFLLPRLVTLLTGVLAGSCGLNAPPLRAEEKALPSDLALVTRDGPGFISIRVGDLTDSAAGKEFLQQLRKDKETTGGFLAELQRVLVVPPGDIERLTIVPGTQSVIIRTVKAYDRDKLLDALGGEARVKRYKGKTMYLGEGGQGLTPIDENVFVRGPVEQLEKVLDDQGSREGKGTLDEALELAAGKHQVVAGLSPLALLQVRAREGAINSVEPKADDASVPRPIDLPVPPPAPPIEKKGPSACGEPPADVNTAKPDPREKDLKGADLTNDDSRPDARELLKRLPPEALPFKPLLQARYVALTFDLDQEARLEARVAFVDKDQAADGETSVKTALYVLREMFPLAVTNLPLDPEAGKQLQPLWRPLQDALKSAVVKCEGTTVTVSARAKVDAGVFAALAVQMRAQAANIQSANNLKQMALAMHSMNDAYGSMPPPAICGRDGKPLLSWRVAILPYIEQVNLYNQFKLDEPWDGPNNKKLLARMPKIYAPVHGKTDKPYSTYYQVFVGPGAPFQIALGRGGPPGAGPGGPFPPGPGVPPGGPFPPGPGGPGPFPPIPAGLGPFGAMGPSIPATFTDGTSNTLLIVEAGEAAPWTKPDDIPFDEKKPVPKLGGDFGIGFHAAMADGSVQFIRKEIDDRILKLLIMPADGNPIDWDQVPVIGRMSLRPEVAPPVRTESPVPAPPDGVKPPPGSTIPRGDKERPPEVKGPPERR